MFVASKFSKGSVWPMYRIGHFLCLKDMAALLSRKLVVMANLSTLWSLDNGSEWRRSFYCPPSLNPKYMNKTINETLHEYFTDFKADDVVETIDDLMNDFLKSESFQELFPNAKSDVIYSIDRLKRLLHKLEALHNHNNTVVRFRKEINELKSRNNEK